MLIMFLSCLVLYVAGAYEYNYRAEALPPANPAPIDTGTKFHVSTQRPEEVEQIHTTHMNINNMKSGRYNGMSEWIVSQKLLNTKEWNHSTELLPSQKATSYENLMNASAKHTKMQNKKTSGKSNYISPIERGAKVGEEVRKLKATGSFSKDRPVFQAAEKPVNRKMLVNRYAIEPSRKFKTTKHSGVWEFNAAEGRHMWSDTGSFDYDSRGDIEELRNPDGYIFSNPTMTGTDQDY